MENRDKNIEFTEEQSRIYHQFGFRSAQNSNALPDSISGYLDKVYEQFLNDQKLDAQGIKDRIDKLKADVQLEKERKNTALADRANCIAQKEALEQEMHELELEKIAAREGRAESTDLIPFVIGAFITILLTLYLFVFYSSSGYCAFYGIKPGSVGFLNPNVFSDAMHKGGGVIALILLFPVIFLGLGFLIHNTMEKNEKLAKENKTRNYWLITVLLLLTLVADAFIGYKITQGIYINNFNSGLVDAPWRFSYVAEDPNFYLVLLLGFVVYVIWGILLHYVLSHPVMKSESEKTKLMLEHLNKKLVELRNKLAALSTQINKLEMDIANMDARIKDKESNIIGYQHGHLPINVAALKSLVGSFVGGWQAYAINSCGQIEGMQLIKQALAEQENWLNEKIATLSNEQ
jgi:hypothetical protein